MAMTTDAHVPTSISNDIVDDSALHIVSQSQDSLDVVPGSSDAGMNEGDSDARIFYATDTAAHDTKGAIPADEPIIGDSSPLETTMASSTTNDADEPPPPRFSPFAKVYARDGDGILYVAVIRRRLYGPKYNAQVILGMHTNEEADAILEEETEPSWHYFVHYNQWSVRFDRWVSDEDIFVLDDERNKAYAERVMKAHQALQKEMGKKKKGKQTLNGIEFLSEWRRRLDSINAEMGFTSQMENLRKSTTNETDKESGDRPLTDTTVAARKPKPPSRWTKEKTSKERKLRPAGLTTEKRSPSSDIVLPPAFKKELVEQWELVCQCDMLPILPCDISIRQALQEYVDSKSAAMLKGDEPKQTSEPSEAANTTDHEEPLSTKDNEALPSTEGTDTPAEDQNERWRVMADGIARFFDEALPSRLLYKQELILLDAFEKKAAEFAKKAYSEVFGCGHLLRLFVNLSDILEETMEDEDRRPIVAKLNDFIRYLNKNQGRLLVQRYKNPIKKLTASKKRAGGAVKGAPVEKAARVKQPPGEE